MDEIDKFINRHRGYVIEKQKKYLINNKCYYCNNSILSTTQQRVDYDESIVKIMNRNQTTIKTLHTIKENRKFLYENKNKINKNNNNNIDLNINNCKNNYKNNMKNKNYSENLYDKDLKKISSSRCNFILRSSLKVFNAKKLKFHNLYIYICIWLLLLQKVQSRPIRIMSTASVNQIQSEQQLLNNGKNDENSGKCSDKIGYLKNHTIFVYKKLVLEGLNEYTQSVFSQSHDQFHQQTIHHVNDWIVPNGEHLKFLDYADSNQEMPAVNVDHLQNSDESVQYHLRTELQTLNARLQIVKFWLEHYRERTSNHDVKKYFASQLEHIETLISLNKQVMSETLHILPNEVDFPKETKDKLEFIGWYATREYLKILVYAKSALEKLQELCINEENL